MNTIQLVEVKLTQQGSNNDRCGHHRVVCCGKGDHVERGQEIVEVDAAKASFPIAAPIFGKIVSIKRQVDDNVLVGEVIAN